MSKYKSPLLNNLQKKSRIYLDGIDEDALEEKQYYSRRQFLDTSVKSALIDSGYYPASDFTNLK